MKKLCPSCGGPLGPKHAARHAKYVIAHRRAVRKLQRKYAKGGKQCCGCGGKLVHYAWMCDRCEVGVRRRNRRYNGSKAWKPGSKGGYKPFVPDESFPLTGTTGRCT